MMIPDITRDPPRDPELAAWLRALDDERDAVSFAGFQATVRTRAEMALARLRLRPSWWEVAAAWARPAIPAAAAAGIALALAVGKLPAPLSTGEDAAAGMPSLEEVLAGGMPDPDYYQVLAGGWGPDALLRIALEER